MRVTILGAGLMGAQIGCEYALGGHTVVLQGRNLDRARNRVDAGLELVRSLGLRASEDVANAAARVSYAADIGDAADGARLVVESLPEDLELKARALRQARTASAEAVLASNTSSLSISALGEAVGAPERTLGTHYWNPPLLMPLVEIVAGDGTSPDAVAFVRDIIDALGKRPVLVARDVPGFVWNRLQFALVRECVWLVGEGVASAETVDEVVRDGLARRWRHVGPFRAMALGGVQTWNLAGDNIVPTLSAAPALPDLGRFALDGGDVEGDARRRDAGLAKELRDEAD